MTLGLGIEIGGTKLQAGIGGEDGKLLTVARTGVTPSRGGAGIREALPGLVSQALSQAGCTAEQIASIGVGFGGPVDSIRGKVLVSHQVEGWTNFPLRDWIAEQWKVPVVLQNDCKCAAFAEASLGAGRGLKRVFYVTIGSGIGGGFVADGKIDDGQGLGAGEIGHTWVPDPAAHGKPEKLERVASGWSIGRRAAQRMGRDMLAQQKNGWRVPDQKLKKMAIWTYYVGAVRDGGKDEGATTIAYLPNKDWFWYIPLPGDMVSVGVVAEREALFGAERDLETIFQRAVEKQPWIQRHLAEGEQQGEYLVTSDFSYRSQFCAQDWR